MIDVSEEALRRVVEAALVAAPQLRARNIMLVGALCRDVLHRRLGHTFTTTATQDLDLGLALSSWESYLSLAAAFPAVGDTGVRFRIAGVDVDLLPFGDVDDPRGTVEPPTRHEPMSVWAFREIFAGSQPWAISPNLTISIPTIPGYTAAKLGAWLDRSAYGQVKDASNIALTLFPYAESAQLETRLYETANGNAVLLQEGMNVPVAAARLLGADIAYLIGPDRLSELLTRWPGSHDLLIKELVVRADKTTANVGDRIERVAALTRGLRDNR